MLAMSGQRAVPRRSTLGSSESIYACSWSSCESSAAQSAEVLNLSVRTALRNTPGIISSRRYSIDFPSQIRIHGLPAFTHYNRYLANAPLVLHVFFENFHSTPQNLRAARSIQPAEPVYQLQPASPYRAGFEYTSAAMTKGSAP